MKSVITSHLNYSSLTLPPDTALRITRQYGDPVMVKYYGLTTALTKDNFCHIDLFDPEGGFGAVTKFWTLCEGKGTEYQFLMSLQPGDVPESEMYKKENFLIGDVTEGGPPSRPLWWAKTNLQQVVLRCGTSVCGAQPVLIQTKDGIPIVDIFSRQKYPAEPAGTSHDIPCYRVVGMTKADLWKVTNQSHPYWIHQWSEAMSRQGVHDIINWEPRGGKIYSPVWGASWKTNTAHAFDRWLPVNCVLEG